MGAYVLLEKLEKIVAWINGVAFGAILTVVVSLTLVEKDRRTKGEEIATEVKPRKKRQIKDTTGRL